MNHQQTIRTLRKTTDGQLANCRRVNRSRRGAVTVLAAVLMVVMLAFVAFAIDVGYMMTVKTQLQVAADSAAMAAAGDMANTQTGMITTAQKYGAGTDSNGTSWHKAGGAQVSINSNDVQYGLWDSTSRTFTSTGSTPGNAVKVIARRDSSNGGAATFFGRIFGVSNVNVTASAVALSNPRDICFVVDLSGSMNDDTVTGYGSSASYRSSGYTTIYNTMMQQVYTDFGFGTYPGTTQKFGSPLGSSVTWSGSGTNGLYSTTGPLSKTTISTTYRIKTSDSTAAAQKKAYSWMIDNQIASIMPSAKPTPNSANSSSYTYWQQYLSDINSNSGVIGYRSYVTWLMEYGGRDQTVDSAGDYGQLSTKSPNCVYHNETVGSTSFSFPPSEQPTHSERRSVIAGLQEVKSKNSTVSDPNQKDWVSIVTFDKVGGVKTLVGLTSNYDSTMTSATTMQAVGNNGASTDTEEGLLQAYNLIKAQSQGGTGRENTQKVVILLTDGVANLKDSSNSTISSYESAHTSTYNGSSNYYGSSDYNSDAALMQANMMQGNNWHVYALALGLAADYDFMDRMARMGGTDTNGQAPRTSGDPSTYEAEMTTLLDEVVDNPEVRLVQ